MPGTGQDVHRCRRSCCQALDSCHSLQFLLDPGPSQRSGHVLLGALTVAGGSLPLLFVDVGRYRGRMVGVGVVLLMLLITPTMVPANQEDPGDLVDVVLRLPP